MKEEISAINQRLDQMQGQLLAHQVFLLAVAQDLRGKDWAFLLDMSKHIDGRLDQLRYSPLTDLALNAFRAEIQQLYQTLSETQSADRPF